jgi:hypothetical protein
LAGGERGGLACRAIRFRGGFQPGFAVMGGELAEGRLDAAERGDQQQEQRPVGRPQWVRCRRLRQVQQVGLELLVRGAG